MIWIVIIIIVAAIFFVVALFGKLPAPQTKLTYGQLQNLKFYKVADEFEKINNFLPKDGIYYFEKLEQSFADDIFNHRKDRFTDWLVERAFLKKYRWGKIDVEFWIEAIDERDFKKLNKHLLPKSQTKRRTRKEIFNELFSNDDEHNEKIDGFIYVADFEITGIHISDRFDYLVNECEIGEVLSLIEDDLNRYDSHAVKIMHRRKTVGYISSSDNKFVRKVMKYGYIAKFIDYDEQDDYCSAYISLYVRNINLE
ncbi:hypothetical protein EG338_07560 [Kaistella haifensis]|nr:hypothetical protein EG338_07560 [Kaistella haifensis]